jgi:hypothetical protein
MAAIFAVENSETEFRTLRRLEHQASRGKLRGVSAPFCSQGLGVATT